MRIINFGSLNLDYTYTVDHIVRAGETRGYSGAKDFLAAVKLNQSIALARAGLEVHHAGMIGEDGEMLVDLCRKENIHTHYIWKFRDHRDIRSFRWMRADRTAFFCMEEQTGNLPKIISMKCWRISARRISYLCRTRSIS